MLVDCLFYSSFVTSSLAWCNRPPTEGSVWIASYWYQMLTVNIFALAVCSWFHFMNMVSTTEDFRHSFVLSCSHWSLAVLRGRSEQSQAVTLFKLSLRIQCCSDIVSGSRAVSKIVSRSRAVQTWSLGVGLFKHCLWEQGCSNIVSGSKAVQTLSLGAGLFKHSLWEQGCSNIVSGTRALQTHSLGLGCSNPRLFKHGLWEQGYSDLASGNKAVQSTAPRCPTPNFVVYIILLRQNEENST